MQTKLNNFSHIIKKYKPSFVQNKDYLIIDNAALSKFNNKDSIALYKTFNYNFYYKILYKCSFIVILLTLGGSYCYFYLKLNSFKSLKEYNSLNKVKTLFPTYKDKIIFIFFGLITYLNIKLIKSIKLNSCVKTITTQLPDINNITIKCFNNKVYHTSNKNILLIEFENNILIYDVKNMKSFEIFVDYQSESNELFLNTILGYKYKI